MNRDEFDARYPAMFQPGGEDHDAETYVPEPLPRTPEPASFRASRESSEPREVRAAEPNPRAQLEFAQPEFAEINTPEYEIGD